MRGGVVAALLLLSACAAPPPPFAGEPYAPSRPDPSPTGERPAQAWERLIKPADRQRILGADEAWASALASARRAGHADRLQALGPLAVERAAQLATPPEGDFRCRTIKLGAAGPGLLDYVAYDWFRCRIVRESDGYALTKLTGSQRQVGRLYPDPTRGWVFVGVLAIAGDPVPAYGQDPEQDAVGLFQKIGDQHWRLVLPWSRRESQLDLIEFRPETR